MNKEEQIEEMANEIAIARHGLCTSGTMDCDNCTWRDCCYFFEIAKILTAKGYRKQEWVSVDEELPQDNERVLVVIDAEGSYTTIDTDRRLKDRWARWGGSVTHWMPLPQPPKEREDTE